MYVFLFISIIVIAFIFMFNELLLKLFFVNTSMSKEIENDKPDIIHTIGLRSFQSIIAWRVSKKLNIPLVVSDQGGLTTHPFLTESGFFLKTLYKIQDFFIRKIIKIYP